MAEEHSDAYFLFSGWAHAGLPHKRLADEKPWSIQTEHD
jgi:hypothetical protein